MFRIFDPVVREVDRLVTEQVNKVKLLRLGAGGFYGANVKARTFPKRIFHLL